MSGSAALRFVAVGVGATVMHVGAGAGLVLLVGVPLAAANVAAFLVAFLFSYLGHWTYSFRGNRAAGLPSFFRFCCAAPACVCVNQCQLLALSAHTALPEVCCLAIATINTACLSFVVSAAWTFRPD